MEQFTTVILPYILSGISVGGQYALIAIGYTMVYGILRLINFAHGDVFMVAGLMMVYLSAALPLYLAVPVVALLTVALGFVIEKIAYKPLRSAPRMSVMISAIGVSYLLQNLALYVTGGLNKTYPTIPWISDQVDLFGATTKRVTLITPVLTIILVILLVQLINHTKVGMAMRAVAKDFETSQLMGIKINNVISVTFIIGSFLAAVGSMLYFSNYPGVVPTSGAMPGLKAFVAAVFGGIGSIPGAVIGAFIIGVFESLIKGLDTILTTFHIIQSPLELSTFIPVLMSTVCIGIIVLLINSSYGRAFKAIRENEIAAEAMGINLARHKMLSFCISSFFAGVAGAGMAMVLGIAQANNFKSAMTYEILLMVVLGGSGSISGSVIGATLFIAASEWWLRGLDNGAFLGIEAPGIFRNGFRLVVFSVIIMVVVLFFRKGIMGDKELPDLFKRRKKAKGVAK